MTRRLPDLDSIALPLMLTAAARLGIPRTRANTQKLARLQIGIREAMRAALPDDDPRRDPAWPFNEPPSSPTPRSGDGSLDASPAATEM